jgi:hypothetical protein
MLKPHAQTLVSRLVFPQLRFDQEKLELYSEDPVEYVRITNEEFEDYSSPRSAAVNFLLTLAQTRPKSEFMPILEFVNHVLKESPAPEDKYAALNMIVALAAVIMRNDDVKPAMETFVMTFVFPEFRSPVGFLREIVSDLLFVRKAIYARYVRPARLLGVYPLSIWNGKIQKWVRVLQMNFRLNIT